MWWKFRLNWCTFPFETVKHLRVFSSNHEISDYFSSLMDRSNWPPQRSPIELVFLYSDWWFFACFVSGRDLSKFLPISNHSTKPKKIWDQVFCSEIKVNQTNVLIRISFHFTFRFSSFPIVKQHIVVSVSSHFWLHLLLLLWAEAPVFHIGPMKTSPLRFWFNYITLGFGKCGPLFILAITFK